jgi:hypothetical protein
MGKLLALFFVAVNNRLRHFLQKIFNHVETILNTYHKVKTFVQIRLTLSAQLLFCLKAKGEAGLGQLDFLNAKNRRAQVRLQK